MKSDVWTTICSKFEFPVKALTISNSLYHHNFHMKTNMNAKIGSYTKLCTHNKILATKTRNLKQQQTSVFSSRSYLEKVYWLMVNAPFICFNA